MTDSNHTETDTNSPEEPASSETVPATKELKPLRIWPPILLLIGMVLTRLAPRLVESDTALPIMLSVFGPLVCGGLILVWWVLASRATWKEKLMGLFVVLLAGGATLALIDPTMQGPGAMLITGPMGLGLFGIVAVLVSRMKSVKRTLIIVTCSVLGFAFSLLLRAEGMWGDYDMGLAWRWTPTVEDKLLAREDVTPDADQTVLTAAMESALAKPEWPGFRGALRDGILTGVSLEDDWNPEVGKPLWKISIGPGWSSFVVAGPLLFTQEQRGEEELIVCYNAETGAELWKREIKARFFDPLGGPGPRATPVLVDGALYVQGASGHVLRLDPQTGKIVWQQDIRKVADREPPMWGFSSSPLVVDGMVFIYAGGKEQKGLLAFDAESGDLKWSAPAGDHSYSSPALLTIENQPVIAMLTNKELTLLDPADGTVLLKYDCPSEGQRTLQPQLAGENEIMIATGMGKGIQKIRVTNNDGKWTAEEVWIAPRLKPDFNDFVIYDGHAYGFDGTIFTCFDLNDGKRKWKGGRYGKGQVLLVKDSGHLLVISEQGEVVLLKADPSGHQELATFSALEGKTWNHPVLIGDRLYVRNSEQAAAYRLPVVK
ncbi:Outer membrane protein assembly factor BamB precursor [Gimesia alba]|uniref:Outer membrane protein assembly factor BamB n=1 Tax=Gimesia alba TaxID=2527973 RepID=A0A517RPR3_9PLAN|nr:PQQ-binding-like beta-propeller repeat protein [Gimesia alba]QDT45871.1 Outer membrane protein assembly factor BamB precursor [Gimesia alba]